jgi:hypothetical protein
MNDLTGSTIPLLRQLNPRLDTGIQSSSIRQGNSLPKAPLPSQERSNTRPWVHLWSADTVQAATRLSQERSIDPNNKIVALHLTDNNAANKLMHNSSFKKDRSLCHRTTLQAGLDLVQAEYPLKDTQLAHFPDVYVIRDQKLADLTVVNAFFIDVISCDATWTPHKNADGKPVDYNPLQDLYRMRDKITDIMRLAAATGAANVVLTPLNCGATIISPKDIAQLILDILIPRSENDGEDWQAAGIRKVIIAINPQPDDSVRRDFVDAFRPYTSELSLNGEAQCLVEACKPPL